MQGRHESQIILSVLITLPCLLLLWPAHAVHPELSRKAQQTDRQKGNTADEQVMERSATRPAAGGTRGPSAIAFSQDGSRAYIAEKLSGTVAVLDSDSGKLIARIDSGGKEPTGLTLSEDGATLFVANSFSDTLGMIDTAKNTLRTSTPLRGGPWSVVTYGGKIYASLSRLDQIAVINSKTGLQESTIPVGRRPKSLALTADGKSLICANMTGGSLSVLSTESAKETSRLNLGAINLRGTAISSDGTEVCVVGQIPHNDKPTSDPEGMWSNVVVVARLTGTPKIEKTIPLDAPANGAADPSGVALASGATYVTLAGTHQIVRLASESASATPNTQRIPVEANPVSVTVRPGGEIWCANALGNSVSVLSPNVKENPVVRTIRLDPPDRPDIRLRGRYLFSSAHITKGGRFTCSTCHPDGGSDGLVWKFAHTSDGLDVRNSRDLRGVLLMTGPYGWTGRENDLEAFIADEIHGLFQGPRFRHSDLHAYWDLVNQMELPPNPYRNSDGSLTDAARRGKEIFVGAGGCATCHKGLQSGGTKQREWIGTISEGVKLDVPHLQGSYDSAPYLHDGSASTMEDVFQKRNSAGKHGKANLLSEQQLRDVLEYVREL